MQILFFIGNGFDLNLGLETKYSQFYDNHYVKVNSQKESVKKFKSYLTDEIPTWADLERTFGEYTEHIKSESEFDEVFEDIGGELSNYLKKQEKNFNVEKLDINNFIDCLCFPESRLPRGDRNKLYAFKDRWKSRWFVNIITLNYTETLEKFLGGNTNNLKLSDYNEKGIYLKGLEHLHGYTDDRMVFGVNDISQLKNSKFHNNQDILDAVIKIDCNKSLKHTLDDWSIGQIHAANLICIFGCSIGDTDKFWWEQIGRRLKDDCMLIIYDTCEAIPSRIAYKKARKEREMLQRFLSKTNLSEDEKNAIKDKIFVGINTEMFKV
ncbi:MAG: hypothetical protein EOP00_16855 [Pedobacter sp.]|nr:MAG: hypothetical protein EOP00_16855 [Pedobacter sp.]